METFIALPCHRKKAAVKATQKTAERSLPDCFKDIGLRMEENKLKLNDDKTGAIRFSASSSVNTTVQLLHTMSLSTTEIEFSGIVCNLDLIFDSDLSKY